MSDGWSLLLLAGLAVVWAAVLVPATARRGIASPMASVAAFERGMGLLAETEHRPGRYVLVPGPSAVLGRRDRAFARAQHRRRMIFTGLLEALGVSALISLFPPLRMMVVATGLLAIVLLWYVGYLLRLKEEHRRSLRAAPRRVPPSPVAAPAEQPERIVLENELRIYRRERDGTTQEIDLPGHVRLIRPEEAAAAGL